MSDTNEAILSKVKKLFALGTSANEAEASSAIEKAHKLLKDYNLSVSDISTDHKYGIIEESVLEGKNSSNWKTRILQGAANANYCDLLIYKSYSLNGKTTVQKFVGKEHNIIVAREMALYLVQVVESLSKKFSGSDRGSYKIGMATTLHNRLLALKIKDKEECTALVVQEESMIKDYLKNKNITEKKMPALRVRLDAYHQGSEDGKQVSLNNQIC